MSQHKQLALALSLKSVAPFSELPLATLFIVAGAAAKRRYQPGAEILAAGAVPDEVHVPIGGSAERGGLPVDHAFDIACVAFDRPLDEAYCAGEAGCATASITKSHIFTLLRECPELSLVLARMPNGGTLSR